MLEIVFMVIFLVKFDKEITDGRACTVRLTVLWCQLCHDLATFIVPTMPAW